MYRLLLQKNVLDSFTNVEELLRIYLVIMSTNVTGERSFSMLRFIQNPHRTSMTECRLNNLTILNMNKDILRRF